MNKTRLRRIRLDLDLTQEQMAQKLGMSHSGYWKQEKGLIPVSELTELKLFALGQVPHNELSIMRINTAGER